MHAPARSPPHDAFNAQIAARLDAEQAIALELDAIADVAVAAVIVRTVAIVSGFSARVAAEVATAAAELASNAVRHVGAGVLTVTRQAGRLVVVVVDRGTGTAAALREHLRAPAPNNPARGGLGHGVAAVARLMSGLEFEDRDGGGVVVRAWRDPS